MQNYWYIIIFAVVLVAAVFIWIQAIKSMGKSGKMRRETIAKLDRFNALAGKYEALTAADLGEIADADLFDVAMIRLWKKLGKPEEEMENFLALSDEEKNVYTAWYIREEVTNEGFSAYFRNCGNALGKISVDVLGLMGLPELDAVMKTACEMFDEESEVSCDKEQIKAVNEQFRAAYNAEEYCAAAAQYIKANADKFIDAEEAAE